MLAYGLDVALMRVYKYPVPITDEFEIDMPDRAQVLSLGVQQFAGNGGGPQPVLWALVDPEQAPRPYRFRLAGTGHPVDPVGRSFVGTFQIRLPGGEFVGHLWMEGE